jgi:heat shock protein HtpX
MAAALSAVLLVNLLAVGLVAALLAPSVAALVPTVPSVVVQLLLVVALFLASLFVQLRSARAATLASVDTVSVADADRSDLRERLDRLAHLADTTTPRLVVADSDAPNSFSVGGSDPVVVLSEGLIDRLDEDELDAVLAHELAHLRNRDATVLTLAGFLPTLVSDEPVAGLPGWLRSNLLGGALVVCALFLAAGNGASPLAFLVAVVVGVVLGGVVVGVLATPVVYLARRLSHDREFVADRTAARLSGDPAALASALRTLDEAAPDTPETDLRSTGGMVSELCLLPGGFDREAAADGGFAVELRTHPPTEERIERLRSLAG